MATYQTIAELLSTTANMTVIRENSRNDDGTDTLTGVDWFLFKNQVATNIYVNGNGWINFGSAYEGGLKVNRRDQALWYLWREEGNIQNSNNKFLRIRWRGYSYYNTTVSTALLEFDVVLCSTGDIILKIHTWPTSYIDGTNQLEAASNVHYSPSSSMLEFSFIHQDEQGNYFTLESGIDEVFTPRFTVIFQPSSGYGTMQKQKIDCGVATNLSLNAFTKRYCDFIGWDDDESADTVIYTDGESVEDLANDGEVISLYAVWRKNVAWLIKDGNGKIYTIDRDYQSVQTRRELTGISTLTARVFYENGFQFPPHFEVLSDLYRPSLYKWNANKVPDVNAAVMAIPIVPLPQLVVFDEIRIKNNIQLVTITGDANSKWNVSFDSGASWWKYVNDSWVVVTTDGDGCTKGNLENLNSSIWSEKAVNTIQFRCWMMAGGWVNLIRIDY
jgi:hypothetical protein